MSIENRLPLIYRPRTRGAGARSLVFLNANDAISLLRRLFCRASGNREIKCCSVAQFAFRPGSAAMTRGNSPHNGQANASALEVPAGVQSLKDAEQFVGVLRIEADAVVLHEEGMLLLARIATDLD